MTAAVFCMWHIRASADEEEDVKFIGVFSTEIEAAQAKQLLLSKPGFADHPDGFQIEKYPIGKVHWEEGFISGDT
jgi:hypothetical protein